MIVRRWDTMQMSVGQVKEKRIRMVKKMPRYIAQENCGLDLDPIRLITATNVEFQSPRFGILTMATTTICP